MRDLYEAQYTARLSVVTLALSVADLVAASEAVEQAQPPPALREAVRVDIVEALAELHEILDRLGVA